MDPAVLEQAQSSGLGDEDLANVEIRDFVLDPPERKFLAIAANPPYIRHHRLTGEAKAALSAYARAATGLRIDGRAGLHVYFLIRSLASLAPHGRLAYIVFADICEGVFAERLWQWICSRYRLDGVVTFSPEASPFPDVDTNAVLFLIANEPPQSEFRWLSCHTRSAEHLLTALDGETLGCPGNEPVLWQRTMAEGLSTGFSRFPSTEEPRFRLGDFATVMRGIVTGSNDFFFKTSRQARRLGIPSSHLVRAIGRTRDVEGRMW